jgi:DNA-binding MarR family transcriptional regulator
VPVQGVVEVARVDVDDLEVAMAAAASVLDGLSTRSLAAVNPTLTLTQFRMLAVLEARGQLRLSRLAEHLGVDPSTALSTVNRLVPARLMTRGASAGDARRALSLTEAGRRTVVAVTSRRRRAMAALLASISPPQRAELAQVLRALSNAGGASPALGAGTLDRDVTW